MHSENTGLFNKLVFDKKYLILIKNISLMLCSISTNYEFLSLLIFFLFATPKILSSQNAARLTRPPNLRSADMLSFSSSTA